MTRRFHITGVTRFDADGATATPVTVFSDGSWGSWVWLGLGVRDFWRYGPGLHGVRLDLFWYVNSSVPPGPLPSVDPFESPVSVERISPYVRSMPRFDLQLIRDLANSEITMARIPDTLEGYEILGQIFLIDDPDGDEVHSGGDPEV